LSSNIKERFLSIYRILETIFTLLKDSYKTYFDGETNYLFNKTYLGKISEKEILRLLVFTSLVMKKMTREEKRRNSEKKGKQM
jgi:hypothetical protein